ncbi:MAG: sigma-70 family RNA polymerase sigma factor [Planctomycetaceae bacterium]
MREVKENYQQRVWQVERDQLVLEHRDLVQHVLGRVLAEVPNHVDRENLEGAGLLGLVEAAARFDPQHGASFRSFAYLRIRGAIIDELRRNCPLPQRLLNLWGRIREFTAQTEQYPTAEELAAQLEVSTDEVLDCLSAVQVLRFEDWQDELSPVIRTTELEQSLEREDQQQLLAEAILELPERLRQVITLYYAEQLRLKEIGEVLGLSESRVSRLLSQAHATLKNIVTRMENN